MLLAIEPYLGSYQVLDSHHVILKAAFSEPTATLEQSFLTGTLPLRKHLAISGDIWNPVTGEGEPHRQRSHGH